MVRRAHIGWKTHYAAALLALRQVPYDDAKRMTEDQIISLYHLDHNILHETEDPNRDLFWNLTPMFIGAHRVKTKKDIAIVAKSRRIRKRLAASTDAIHELLHGEAGQGPAWQGSARQGEVRQGMAWRGKAKQGKARIRSRGFDKTKTRGFDGKVRKRRKR